VPFSPLSKPLSHSCVALVTTAAPYKPDAGDQGPGAAYNGAAKFYSVYEMDIADDADLRISHIAYDRQHTSASDINSWFPRQQLLDRHREGRVGRIAPSFFGLPTNRSHRVTLDIDCPELVSKAKRDEIDACVLVANCPVCHQSVSLAARALEQSGIATVVMGCARDIVEFVGVPRFLFSDFPLGNAAGRPNDLSSQRDSFELALRLLESAPAARTTLQSSQRWSENPEWKLDYCNVERLSPEQLASLRSEFDRQKQVARRAGKG